MMTPKQNALEVYKWGKPEYLPMYGESHCIAGAFTICASVNTPMSSQKDGYGVQWTRTPEGSIPDNRVPPILTDITCWREQITLPNPAAYRDLFFALAKKEEAMMYDRENKLIDVWFSCGLFERLAALMGFEEALMALLLEEEACHDLFRAITDVNLEFIDLLAEAHNPDIITYCDDICTARAPFFSMEIFDKLFRPYEQELIDRIHQHGLIANRHLCGNAEAVVGTLVDMGYDAWTQAQGVVNDIAAMQKICHGKMVIMGGWFTGGPASPVDASEEVVRAEVRRCIESYKPAGGYIMAHLLLSEMGTGSFAPDPRIPTIMDEYHKYRAY